MSDTCSRCGSAGRDRLIPVVDETGSTAICGLCLIAELPRWVLAGGVTVLVARPSALPT
jgi:hypothetical protein